MHRFNSCFYCCQSAKIKSHRIQHVFFILFTVAAISLTGQGRRFFAEWGMHVAMAAPASPTGQCRRIPSVFACSCIALFCIPFVGRKDRRARRRRQRVLIIVTAVAFALGHGVGEKLFFPPDCQRWRGAEVKALTGMRAGVNQELQPRAVANILAAVAVSGRQSPTNFYFNSVIFHLVSCFNVFCKFL